MSKALVRQRSLRHGFGALGWLMVLTIFAMVTVYMFVGFKDMFHNDAAVKAVAANLAVAQGRLIPTGWVFANGDLLTLTPYVFVLPLTALFGSSFETTMLGTWMAYAAMLSGVAFLGFACLPRDRWAVATAVGLAAAGLGAAHFGFVVTEGTYALYPAVALPLFALVLLGIDARQSPTRLIVLAAFSALLATDNPRRALVLVLIPLIAALCMRALAGGPGRWQRLMYVASHPSMLAIAVGAMVGALLRRAVLLPNVLSRDAAANVSLATGEQALDVARQLPGDWFRYFVVTGPWDDLTASQAILQVVAWIVAILLLVAPAWVIARHWADRRLSSAGILCYCLLGTALLSLVALDGLYTRSIEIRYCTLGILFGLVMIAVAVADAGRTRATGRVLSMALLAVGVFTAAKWPESLPTRPQAGANLEAREALITRLREHRVGRAVSPYWSSHVLSVLSEFDVIVHPLSDGGRLWPFGHHLGIAPMRGNAGARDAVILTEADAARGNGGTIELQLGPPLEVIDVHGFKVWIYDRPVIDLVFANNAAVPR